jgi:hypothetical protein
MLNTNTYFFLFYYYYILLHLLILSYSFPFFIAVSQQLIVPNKKPRFGPKVVSEDLWFDKIKEAPETVDIDLWKQYTTYQSGHCRVLSENNYLLLGDKCEGDLDNLPN